MTNPLGNIGIEEIDINIPLAASTTTPTIASPAAGMPTSACTVAGTGPWTVVCVSNVASGAVILPAGAAAVLKPGWTTETKESTTGTADAYGFTVTVTYTSGSTQTSKVTFYEGSLATTNVVATTAPPTAGASVTYSATAETAALTSDSGIPLMWFSNPSTAGVAGDGFTASFGTPSFTTGSSTTYTSTFTATEASETSCANADNGAIDSNGPCGYFAWVDAGTPSAYDTLGFLTPSYASNAGPPADAIASPPVAMDSVAVAGEVTVTAAGPTQVSLGTCDDKVGYSITVIDSSLACALTISLADKYGNTVGGVTAATATLTPALGSVYCADVAPASCSTHGTAVTSAGFTFLVTYAPIAPTTDYPLNYGTYDTVSATLKVTAAVPASIEATYAGVSKSLEIGNLYGAAQSPTPTPTPAPAATDDIYDAPYTCPGVNCAGNVEAGTPVNLAATYGAAPAAALNFPAYAREQAGIPVNMSLATTAASVGPYTGTFSNKLGWIIVTTSTSGVATANFTSDVIAGDAAAASLVAAAPATTSSTNTAAAAVPHDSPFTTGVASPGALLVEADTYSGTGACPPPATTTPSSYIAPSKYMCLDVLLQDSYGNSVNWAGNFALQISLAVSAGSLSGTTVYITSGSGDTSGSGYQVEFTAPATLGTVTITATTTQGGVKSGTDVISVVTISPEVSLTPPVTSTFVSTGTYTATINATAIPSPAAVPGTVIVSFAYSVNGAASVTAPLTGANATGAGFTTFTATLNQGSNTVTIYTTDSVGNTGSATFTFTVSPLTVSPTTFTSTGAAQGTSAGFTGDNVTFTNTGGARTVNVYFVWYNSANQIVNIGAQLNVNFAAGGSQTYFSAFTTPGAYTVQAFVRDTSNNAASTSYSATVTIP